MPSPSPSPPPPAPAQNTPGTRATQLRKIYASALEASLKSNSYANFASCFPTPAQYCPTALEGVWKQLNGRLEQECSKDFDKILQERNVVANLNAWDDVLEAARRRRDRDPGVTADNTAQDQMSDGELGKKPAYLLNATELHNAFLHGYLVKATQELEGKLQSTQLDNQQVMARIQLQREEIQRLVGDIEGLVKDVDGAVAALASHQGEEGIDALRNDAWAMHNEVENAKQES